MSLSTRDRFEMLGFDELSNNLMNYFAIKIGVLRRMKLRDIELLPAAEQWVKDAVATHSEEKRGACAVVLFPDDKCYVVKLTRSKRDFDALIQFSGTNPHFPIVHKHAESQARNGTSIYHALLIEKLAAARIESRAIADLVLRQEAGKHRPFGLISAANNLRERSGRHEFPSSLVDALQNLGVYAFHERLVVDLANPDNWGLRSDGTLVALDLVHSSDELGG